MHFCVTWVLLAIQVSTRIDLTRYITNYNIIRLRNILSQDWIIYWMIFSELSHKYSPISNLELYWLNSVRTFIVYFRNCIYYLDSTNIQKISEIKIHYWKRAGISNNSCWVILNVLIACFFMQDYHRRQWFTISLIM